jgi:adenylate cyclase class 2
MAPTGTETEVKIVVTDLASALSSIERNGFRVCVDRTFEANTLYDTPGRDLRSRGVLLRLRQFGESNVITWKGQTEAGPYKIRPELETSIGSIAVMHHILERLGYEPVFRYEKFRMEFRQPGSTDSGVVTLDETPIGNFLELEGPGDWIDQTARALGYEADRYVLESYGGLYLAYCERHGLEPGNMTFASHPQ